jgi:predicted O-methyltransferase YrrM
VLQAVDSLIDSAMNEPVITVPGLTSPRLQNLIKLLCTGHKTYLEVGSALGSTMAAALSANCLENAYAVDLWKETTQPMRDDLPPLPDVSKQAFIDNVRPLKGNTKIDIFEGDMLTVNKSTINPVEVFFYDGPHDPENTAKAVMYYADVLADEAIIIFDDANFDGVVAGAEQGILAAELELIYNKILLNSVESTDQWWNGVYVTVVRKKTGK